MAAIEAVDILSGLREGVRRGVEALPPEDRAQYERLQQGVRRWIDANGAAAEIAVIAVALDLIAAP